MLGEDSVAEVEALDFIHEVGMRFAELRRLKVGGGNVGETNPSLAIKPTQKPYLA